MEKPSCKSSSELVRRMVKSGRTGEAVAWARIAHSQQAVDDASATARRSAKFLSRCADRNKTTDVQQQAS